MQSRSPKQFATLKYVVLRGKAERPWYKRKIPPALVPLIGASTITVGLPPTPGRAFLAAYARVHADAESRLQAAAAQQGEAARALNADERWGIAGSWAQHAGPQPADTTDHREVAAVLTALNGLEIVLPPLTITAPPEQQGSSWRDLARWRQQLIDQRQADNPAIEELITSVTGSDLLPVAARLHQELRGLDHPGAAATPDTPPTTAEAAAALLLETVIDTLPGIQHWLEVARQELQRLGLVLGSDQRQRSAETLARAAVLVSAQQHAQTAHLPPQPLQFPPPPAPQITGPKVPITRALEVWIASRQPAQKSLTDATARLSELQAHTGATGLGELTAEAVAAWRCDLLANVSPATARRHLALLRAVLGAGRDNGLPVDPAVLEMLNGRGIRATNPGASTGGVRAFTPQETATIWALARRIPNITERWLWPLALSTGARIEEMVGLKREDVIASPIPAIEIQPSDHRRLKSSSSARTVPLAAPVVREGFVDWALAQPAGPLFHEPAPPASTGALSHYASKRCNTWLREVVGIDEPRRAVFHSCRHSVLSRLGAAGVPRDLISAIAGHSAGGSRTTSRYVHDRPDLQLLADALNQVDWSWVPPW